MIKFYEIENGHLLFSRCPFLFNRFRKTLLLKYKPIPSQIADETTAHRT